MTIFGNQHIDAELQAAFDAAIATLPATTFVSRSNIEDALDEVYAPFLYRGRGSESPQIRAMITVYVTKALGWKKRSNRHSANPVYVRPLE